MSSFGPTVFALGDSNVSENERAARSFMQEQAGGGTTLITAARNGGAAVRVV